MRHGENPHQAAALYAIDHGPHATNAGPVASVVGAKQLHGKELSYNNVADAAAALDLALALAQQGATHATKLPARPQHPAGACVIKHANPCGAALAHSAHDAIDRALAGDPVAAFGGILACTATIDGVAAERLAGKDTFLEVILAPDFTEQALATLRAKSAGVRLLAVGPASAHAPASAPASAKNDRLMVRSIVGGALVQERDTLAPDSRSWRHQAGPAPAGDEALRDAEVVEVIARALASNAIAIGARDDTPAGPCVRLLGAGVGQVDRVTACKLAVEKARQFSPALLASGRAVAVSDAFFPFPDGPSILIEAGIRTIVHTGGSKRDDETFALCNQRGVTCLTTGVRRFRH
jgi:phosphoribosylaminoimidazolecarboxamide formyltransferase/IMP cyclohydrolase